MCTRYISPSDREIEAYWRVGARNPPQLWPRQLFPRSPGPFIRRARDATAYEGELVVGQWALVPWFAKTAKLPYATVNARSEEMTEKASYKLPWSRGQRCIIPAESFDEPNWESGKNVWWRFRRVDGQPWGVAGLWNTWVDKASGEVVESYTMLTVNADAHPLMSRMHKPDPKLGPDQQDKRSLVLLEMHDFDQWLAGTVEEGRSLINLTPVEVFDAAPAEGPP
jgi:putative SOS response-associated peptidase YedK